MITWVSQIFFTNLFHIFYYTVLIMTWVNISVAGVELYHYNNKSCFLHLQQQQWSHVRGAALHYQADSFNICCLQLLSKTVRSWGGGAGRVLNLYTIELHLCRDESRRFTSSPSSIFGEWYYHTSKHKSGVRIIMDIILYYYGYNCKQKIFIIF